MMGYEEISTPISLLPIMQRKHGRQLFHRVGNPASFIVLNSTTSTALNNKKEVLYNFTRGNLIAKTKPAEKEALF